MTIALVSGQNAGAIASPGTAVSRAFPSNLTVGSLVIVVCSAWTASTNDPMVVGDISQSAGTATLGAWSLDAQIQENVSSGGTQYLMTSLFSAIVTGAGSCTVQVSGFPSGSYSWIAVAEFSGKWDASRFVQSASDRATAQVGVAPSSGNASSNGPALFIGAAATYSGANPVPYTEDGAFTSIYASTNGGADHTGEAIYRIVSGATTDAASWTAPTNENWQAIVGVYKEADSTPPFARKYDPTLWHQLHNVR